MTTDAARKILLAATMYICAGQEEPYGVFTALFQLPKMPWQPQPLNGEQIKRAERAFDIVDNPRFIPFIRLQFADMHAQFAITAPT